MNRNQLDYFLVFLLFLLMISSCIAIAGAQEFEQYKENFVYKQFIWFILGTVLILIIFLFDFEQINIISPFLYLFGVLLLIGVLVAPESIAPYRNGAKSWFIIPGLGFSFQPSEFMKIFLILMLSRTLYIHSEKMTIGILRDDFLLVTKMISISALPILLVLQQNDFGTALVMVVITIGITFVSGINRNILVLVFSIIVAAIASLSLIFIYNPDYLLRHFSPYQLNRIYAWLDPFSNAKGIGFQLKQSLLAVGSGMIKGKGLFESQVYIPEAHSDFIFAVVGEQFGFIGGSFVVTLYFLILYRIILISLKNNKDIFKTMIGTGMAAMFTFHVFQNIGMVIGLLPITGIPLPLMSYGGSSVLATMFGMGLVLNISYRKKNYMFGNN